MTTARIGGFAALGAALALIAGTVTTPAAASMHPTPRFDYSMPDTVGDFVGNLPANPANGFPGRDLTGKFVPSQPLATVKSAFGATNYGEATQSGRYRVDLDACASTVGIDAWYVWKIGGRSLGTEDCATSMMLPEGNLDYSLTINDKSGGATIRGKMTVKNVLIAILGDSYSAGDGFPPFRVGGTKDIAWDDATCHRSRWSGFMRAAARVEVADPRSNVTIIDVACSGATVDAGLLGPQNGRPSQVDQLVDLTKGQQIDQALLSIGSGDVGFGEIAATCAANTSATKSCFEDLLVATNAKLEGLAAKFQRTADCLNDGNCLTAKLGGGQSPTPALRIAPARVAQTSYPNLVTGPRNPGSGFPNGTNPQDLCNANWEGAPLRYGDSWWVTNVAMLGVQGQAHQIPRWTSPPLNPGVDTGTTVPFTATADGLGVQLAQNAAKFGWQVRTDPYTNTGTGGLCAYPRLGSGNATPSGQDENRVVYAAGQVTAEGSNPNATAQLNPNERGQDIYSSTLTPVTTSNAGVPVAKRIQNASTKTNFKKQLNPPRKVAVSQLKKKPGKLRSVKISWKAPSSGLTATGYYVRVKVPGQEAVTIRGPVSKTSAVWKAPRGKKVHVKVASFNGKQQRISYSAYETVKIKK